MGVTISSNYYEENNIVPIRFHTSNDAHPVEVICTDLLLNGEAWNQSLAYSAGTPAPIIGRLSTSAPTRGVMHTGNTHVPPGAASAANCTAYAAITAVAVAGRESARDSRTSTARWLGCIGYCADVHDVLIRCTARTCSHNRVESLGGGLRYLVKDAHRGAPQSLSGPVNILIAFSVEKSLCLPTLHSL